MSRIRSFECDMCGKRGETKERRMPKPWVDDIPDRPRMLLCPDCSRILDELAGEFISRVSDARHNLSVLDALSICSTRALERVEALEEDSDEEEEAPRTVASEDEEDDDDDDTSRLDKLARKKRRAKKMRREPGAGDGG